MTKVSNQQADNPSIESVSLQDLRAYMLFDDINTDSMRDACEFIIKSNYMLTSKDTVTMLINSPGGEVYDGFALIDLMQCSKVKIKTVAVGIVASMGALIFTAGERGTRTMSRNSYMMVHQFSEIMEGKYHEILAARPHQDQLQEKMIKHFMANSKLNQKQVEKLLLNSSDIYIEPKEALKMGLCDIIQNPWE